MSAFKPIVQTSNVDLDIGYKNFSPVPTKTASAVMLSLDIKGASTRHSQMLEHASLRGDSARFANVIGLSDAPGVAHKKTAQNHVAKLVNDKLLIDSNKTEGVGLGTVAAMSGAGAGSGMALRQIATLLTPPQLKAALFLGGAVVAAAAGKRGNNGGNNAVLKSDLATSKVNPVQENPPRYENPKLALEADSNNNSGNSYRLAPPKDPWNGVWELPVHTEPDKGIPGRPSTPVDQDRFALGGRDVLEGAADTTIEGMPMRPSDLNLDPGGRAELPSARKGSNILLSESEEPLDPGLLRFLNGVMSNNAEERAALGLDKLTDSDGLLTNTIHNAPPATVDTVKANIVKLGEPGEGKIRRSMAPTYYQYQAKIELEDGSMVDAIKIVGPSVPTFVGFYRPTQGMKPSHAVIFTINTEGAVGKNIVGEDPMIKALGGNAEMIAGFLERIKEDHGTYPILLEVGLAQWQSDGLVNEFKVALQHQEDLRNIVNTGYQTGIGPTEAEESFYKIINNINKGTAPNMGPVWGKMARNKKGADNLMDKVRSDPALQIGDKGYTLSDSDPFALRGDKIPSPTVRFVNDRALDSHYDAIEQLGDD